MGNKNTKGSHIKLVHKDFEKPAIIPYHGSKEIPIGTLNSILSLNNQGLNNPND